MPGLCFFLKTICALPPISRPPCWEPLYKLIIMSYKVWIVWFKLSLAEKNNCKKKRIAKKVRIANLYLTILLCLAIASLYSDFFCNSEGGIQEVRIARKKVRIASLFNFTVFLTIVSLQFWDINCKEKSPNCEGKKELRIKSELQIYISQFWLYFSQLHLQLYILTFFAILTL